MLDTDTPYFLIDEKELAVNIRSFREALRKQWPNSALAYSVKTNSLPWVLEYLCENGVMAEVVSQEEFDLARMCGYLPEQIIYNGPIKTGESFKYALKTGAIVNIDSEREVTALLSQSLRFRGRLGVRVNIDLTSVCPDDVGYHEDGFRFGFSYENGELERVLNVIKEYDPTIEVGLHLHVNSITRSVNVYRAIAAFAARIIREYRLNVGFIDLGGGFFGGVPGKTTPDKYLSVITAELKGVVDTQKVQLLIEPGSALIGSPVHFVTTVLDVKDTAKGRIVTTDGSRINIDPTWRKSGYFNTIESSGSVYEGRQIVCGYTCMDHDRMMVLEDAPELAVDDKIIYHKVGAYTMTFGGPFIRYFPDVYVQQHDRIHKVRGRMTVEDYYRIHNFGADHE